MANGQNTARIFSLIFELIGIGAPMLNRSGVINDQAANIASGISALVLQELQLQQTQTNTQATTPTVNASLIEG
ncbi:MAG: hypothetical protein ACYTXA_24715 [Nostoc sp.]